MLSYTSKKNKKGAAYNKGWVAAAAGVEEVDGGGWEWCCPRVLNGGRWGYSDHNKSPKLGLVCIWKVGCTETTLVCILEASKGKVIGYLKA